MKWSIRAARAAQESAHTLSSVLLLLNHSSVFEPWDTQQSQGHSQAGCCSTQSSWLLFNKVKLVVVQYSSVLEPWDTQQRQGMLLNHSSIFEPWDTQQRQCHSQAGCCSTQSSQLFNSQAGCCSTTAVSLSPVAHNKDNVRVQLPVAQPHHYLGSYSARGSR